MGSGKNLRAAAAIVIASGAYFTVVWLDDQREAATRPARLSGFEARIQSLESVRLEGLSLPPTLSFPDGTYEEARVAQLKERYGALADRVNATTAEPRLPPLWREDAREIPANMVNMLLLAQVIEENPALRTSPATWLVSMRQRIEAVRAELARCPCVRFGVRHDPAIQLAESLERDIDRCAAASDGDTRVMLGALLANHVRSAEATLASARPLPVLNGDAKGTLPASGTLVRFCQAPLALPKTQTFYSDSANDSCSFKLTTRPNESHVYARLVRQGRDAWRGFIRAGDSIRVNLPSGDYTLRYAMGESWFGSSFLFGPASTFSEAGDLIDLRNGYEVTIELIPQVGGNLSERSIDANSF